MTEPLSDEEKAIVRERGLRFQRMRANAVNRRPTLLAAIERAVANGHDLRMTTLQKNANDRLHRWRGYPWRRWPWNDEGSRVDAFRVFFKKHYPLKKKDTA